MAVTRKPKQKQAIPSIDDVINRGGSVTSSKVSPSNRLMFVQLRLTKKIVNQIDRSLKARLIKTPRHTWILEAIHEKLEREKC